LVSSGAVLASANVTGPGNVFLARDPRTGHIWFANNGRVRVMDGSTLATIAERGFTFGTAPARLAFDPDRPIVYIGWKATSEADNLPAHFVVFNTETMAVEAEADILLPPPRVRRRARPGSAPAARRGAVSRRERRLGHAVVDDRPQPSGDAVDR
jgi:hypothetical protein